MGKKSVTHPGKAVPSAALPLVAGKLVVSGCSEDMCHGGRRRPHPVWRDPWACQQRPCSALVRSTPEQP